MVLFLFSTALGFNTIRPLLICFLFYFIYLCDMNPKHLCFHRAEAGRLLFGFSPRAANLLPAHAVGLVGMRRMNRLTLRTT
jgi:hypothetical protein